MSTSNFMALFDGIALGFLAGILFSFILDQRGRGEENKQKDEMNSALKQLQDEVTALKASVGNNRALGGQVVAIARTPETTAAEIDAISAQVVDIRKSVDAGSAEFQSAIDDLTPATTPTTPAN